MADKPYQDEEWLREKWYSDLSHAEIAREAGCSQDTITRYARKFGLPNRQSIGPWRNEEELRRLYHEEKMSQTEIANHFDCRDTTISKWMRKYDIERRSTIEAYTNLKPYANYRTNKRGYEMIGSEIHGEEDCTPVHRLVAIAHGVDPYEIYCEGKVVHHKNGVKWDNRPENLEVLSPSKHAKHHYDKGDYELDKYDPPRN